MKEQLQAWFGRAAAVLALLFCIYLLTAPPVMMAIVRQQGRASFPTIYRPILRVIERDYNGPLLWYFNDVWHSDVILFGECRTSPLVIVTYALGTVLLAGLVAFPFLR